MIVMIIVKIGGRALEQGLGNVLDDLKTLYDRGEKIVFVHGGGDIVTFYSKRLGIEPKFVISPSGVRSRYTSPEELEVYLMVMAGKINKEITAKMLRRNIKAIGLSGVDGKLLLAERKKRIIIVDEKGRKRVIEGGYTGKIKQVNAEVLLSLLEKSFLPVIAPIAYGTEGELLNVDGDQAASEIAIAMKANTLILLTDVQGVIIDNNIVSCIKVKEVKEIVKSVGMGMNRKIILASRAIEGGVKRVIISSALISNPIINALKGSGTVIEP
mgnify:CR=1 FL=1